MGVNDILFYLS